MTIEQGEQKGMNWETWRSLGLGSSDAPVVMGVSPWKTPLQLYLEKIGEAKGFDGNFATERGQRLEPVARAQFELLMDAEFPPMLAVHSEHSFIRASLDGYNVALGAVLEIKCPGKDDHDKALAGMVPEKYIWQVEHQMLVVGAKKAYYYSFDGESGAVVEVLPNLERQKELVKALTAFWGRVKSKTPPKESDRDYVELTDQVVRDLFLEYKRIKKMSDDLEPVLNKIKGEIVDKLKHEPHGRYSVDGVKFVKSVRPGSVDYVKMGKELGIDPEQYRKASVNVYTIRT